MRATARFVCLCFRYKLAVPCCALLYHADDACVVTWVVVGGRCGSAVVDSRRCRGPAAAGCWSPTAAVEPGPPPALRLLLVALAVHSNRRRQRARQKGSGGVSAAHSHARTARSLSHTQRGQCMRARGCYVLVHTNAWCPRRHGCCWRGHGSASGGRRRLCSACSFVHVLLLALLGCALVARVCSAAALPPWFLCTHQDGAGFEPTGCTRGLRSPQAAAPGVNPHPPPLTMWCPSHHRRSSRSSRRARASPEDGRKRSRVGQRFDLAQTCPVPALYLPRLPPSLFTVGKERNPSVFFDHGNLPPRKVPSRASEAPGASPAASLPRP